MARSGDDVAFGLENRGVPAGEIWPRVSDALDRVGFPYPVTRPTAALSGGEAQRLALAGVLALRPGPAAARRADRQPRPGRRRADPRRDQPGRSTTTPR